MNTNTKPDLMVQQFENKENLTALIVFELVSAVKENKVKNVKLRERL